MNSLVSSLLIHLARTGGTLISRCLASMNGVCLLSEINPLGVSKFNPLQQAKDWFTLVPQDEITPLVDGKCSEIRAAIERISARAAERGDKLVVRDWSHLDWIGFPFVYPPPLKFSWDDPAFDGLFDRKVATVRHPLDQYLSTKSLGVLQKDWDDTKVWQGMRRFAEAIHEQGLPWFRYEDFLAAPGVVLEQICDALDLKFDPNWATAWVEYRQITGDPIDPSRRSIKPSERKQVDPRLWRELRGNEDFLATLELLGYPLPEPLRRNGGLGAMMPNPSHLHNQAIRLANQELDSQKSSDVENPLIPSPSPPQSRRRREHEVLENSQELEHVSNAKDWDGEVVRWRMAVDETPEDLKGHLRLAEALRWIGQTDEAAEVLLKTAELCQNQAEELQLFILPLVCDTLTKADRKYDTISPRRRLAQLAPNHRDNLFQLAMLLGSVGHVDEALAYCRRLLEIDRRDCAAAANFLLYLNYSDRYSAAEVSNEHFRMGMRFTEQPQNLPKRKIAVGERIRVGYLSADFHTHPVGKIVLPLLQAHDRRQFEIVAYHNSKKSDGLTKQVREAVDRFTDIHGWSDDRALETIRSDGIDILIDLGGYTGGGNRLRMLARRAAPVQASFLGYPNTSALQTIDYHLTDRFADPPGLTEHFYGETLVWLDHAHLAWQPYPIAEEVTVETRAQHPVLGVFNNVAKISPSAIKTYATIMRRVPEARLILKYGDRFSVAQVQDRYRREFAAHGVLPHRLEFRTRAEKLKEHLQTMMSVDLAMDAFPYQGTMTSLECLAVGTPIISCCGAYYAHRATSAMMMRLGFQELVAGDTEEYVEIAVQLLQDLDSLREFRATVRERFYASPLADPAGLVGELETHFRKWV